MSTRAPRRSGRRLLMCDERKEARLRLVGRERDHALEDEPELFDDSDRANVIRIRHGEQPWQYERLERVVLHGGRRFVRVAAPPVFRQKGEPDVGVRERVAFDQATDPDGARRLLSLHDPQPEAVSLIAADQTLADVAPRIVMRTNAPVADEPKKRRLIQKTQNEVVVVERRVSER